jgi:hypothetical protein
MFAFLSLLSKSCFCDFEAAPPILLSQLRRGSSPQLRQVMMSFFVDHSVASICATCIPPVSSRLDQQKNLVNGLATQGPRWVFEKSISNRSSTLGNKCLKIGLKNEVMAPSTRSDTPRKGLGVGQAKPEWSTLEPLESHTRGRGRGGGAPTAPHTRHCPAIRQKARAVGRAAFAPARCDRRTRRPSRQLRRGEGRHAETCLEELSRVAASPGSE